MPQSDISFLILHIILTFQNNPVGATARVSHHNLSQYKFSTVISIKPKLYNEFLNFPSVLLASFIHIEMIIK